MGRPDALSLGRAPSHHVAPAQGPQPWGRDQQIARIFTSMRAALKVSRETVARRLATSPAIIEDLEAGAVHALPQWKETERIVRTYCELLRIDPTPLLWRLRSDMLAHAGPPAGSPVLTRPNTSPPTQPPPAPSVLRGGSRRKRRGERRRGRAIKLFALGVPVAFVAGLAYLVHVAPAPFYRGVAALPDPVGKPARVGLDYVALATATRRDGLRWIEFSDPRLRKADKLHTSTR